MATLAVEEFGISIKGVIPKPDFRALESASAADLETPVLSTPIRQTHSKEGLESYSSPRYAEVLPSPSIQHKVASARGNILDAGWSSPGRGLSESFAIVTVFGQRLFANSCKMNSTSLFAHTTEVRVNDLDALGSLHNGEIETPKNSITNVHKRKFPSTQESVTECSRLFKTGSKSSVLPGLTNYPTISNNLVKLARDFGDHVIAKTIFDILNDIEITIFDHLPAKKSEANNKLMTKVCYLLFSCEVTRFEGAAITNAMFLDLVMDGEYQISDISGLPLSARRVMPSLRTLNSVLKIDLDSDMQYDLSKKKTPDINSDIVTSIMEKNHEILEDWLKMKFPDSKIEELSIGEISHAITISMGKWFNGIEIKPFTFKGCPVDGYIEDSYDEELSSPHGDHNCIYGLAPSFALDAHDLAVLGVSALVESS